MLMGRTSWQQEYVVKAIHFSSDRKHRKGIQEGAKGRDIPKGHAPQ
jgi:hypothetical protein